VVPSNRFTHEDFSSVPSWVFQVLVLLAGIDGPGVIA